MIKKGDLFAIETVQKYPETHDAALYFFEENDFSGKTIIPFVTHGGSSFSGTIRTIHSHLFKGKYTPMRIFQTIINSAVLLYMLVLMVSGIILSRESFGA